jgi:hypothetical protein
MHLSQGTEVVGCGENGNKHNGFHKMWEFHE